MRTAIDSNVLSAILSGLPEASSLAELLASASSQGALVIGGAVYAELSAHPACSGLDEFLRDGSIVAGAGRSRSGDRRSKGILSLL
ncbi:MAG: hypothetical protein JNN08_20105 [Bryobacterales bacterium]|nr:hypothetical protein [Bryobacterales bacterium]